MRQYKDLNLKKIREECGLVFAHYTYGRNQCSCCYGPLDMAARYWKNGKKPVEVQENGTTHYELNGEWVDLNKLPYILFKNAYNGSGRIKSKEETIKEYTCISYYFKNSEQKDKVCQMLLEQLGEDYALLVPEDDTYCIIIVLVDGETLKNKTDRVEKTYRCIKYDEIKKE